MKMKNCRYSFVCFFFSGDKL